MRILDRFSSGTPVFSFEFFPPKTPQGEATLWQALSELRPLAPDFVSVTYGAGGSTQSRTVELTRRIRSELQLLPMAHLTCVGATREELRSVLSELWAAGVRNILALRGDPPSGESSFQAVEGGFAYASELVGFIRENFEFHVSAACYPEGHVEAVSLDADLTHLKTKVEQGVDFLVTQLFFDNRRYFEFVDRARRIGISVPIVPGIMPVQSLEQVKRFTKMCGASLPPALLERLEPHAKAPERVREIGVAYATLQCLGLLQGGAPGIHFYTLNKSSATRDILGALRAHGRV